jgi:hypothetical protein
MQIEIVKVGKPYKEGKWGKLDIEYIRDGKNVSRKLAAVGKTADVVKVLANATSGEHYEIEVEKNGEYYNWNVATKVENVAPEKKTSYQAAKSTYETPEERARKQVYIARQSSLATATNLLGVGADPDKVVAVAQKFVDFVMGDVQEAPPKDFENSSDDLPWKDQ